MSSRLRVGFTVQNMTMDFSGTGGAALQLTHIIRGLQQQNIHLELLALRGGRRVLFTDDLQCERYGRLGFTGNGLFKLFESGVRRLQGVLHIPYLGLFDSLRFYDACCQNLGGSDVLHERNAMFAIGTAVASRRLGKPYVLSLDADELFELDYMGKPMMGWGRRMAAWAARFTYERAAAFTCVSPVAKRHFVEKWGLPADRIFVLANGVDVPFFETDLSQAAARAAVGLGPEPTIMFVGGFWQWHGLDLLVDSFAEAVRAVPKARLVLVGDGETMAATQARVAHHGLETAVVLVGRVQHHTVPTYLRAADICMAPYPHFDDDFWGAPLKIYEYMAAGKAVIASGAGLIADVVRHEVSGLVVKPGSVSEMAQAMIRLLREPNLRLRLGRNAHQQAREEHSWANYVSQLEAIYRDVLS